MGSYENYNVIQHENKIKLLDFQKVVSFKDAKQALICNWARGLGVSFTIIGTILNERPQKAVVFSITEQKLSVLHNKLSECKKSNYISDEDIQKIDFGKDKIFIMYANGDVSTIYNGYALNQNESINCEYLFFDGIYPVPISYINAKKVVAFIHENNYDHHLEKKFNNAFVSVINEDYKTLLKHDLISECILEQTKERSDWYNEYAIMDKPKKQQDIEIDYNKKPDRKYELYMSYPINDYAKKFLIDTLAELENEYDNVEKNKDTVLTRKNLLNMIVDLQKTISYRL